MLPVCVLNNFPHRGYKLEACPPEDHSRRESHSTLAYSILGTFTETLKYQTQDQLDDNITSLMGQDPSQSYRHKELAKITSSLSHTLIVPLKSSDKHATQLQQELTPAQRRIMQLELEAQERQKGTDEVEQGTEEEINRLKETLAATTRQMEQIKEDYVDRSDKATVCRAATGEGKSWLQGQQLQNKSPWNSLGWVKKRDQPPNTSARLLQRGIFKLPRGTQARLWITPWAFKDMTCTDLTPAK